MNDEQRMQLVSELERSIETLREIDPLSQDEECNRAIYSLKTMLYTHMNIQKDIWNQRQRKSFDWYVQALDTVFG